MKEKKCPVCEKGKLVNVDDIVSEVEGYLFIEKGNRCDLCGEEFIPEDVGQKMIKVARRMKIWGKPLKLYRKLSKSGRGTVLRIPSDLEKNLDIKGDEIVIISKVGKNKILIEIESTS
jgi:hypothetical protein